MKNVWKGLILGAMTGAAAGAGLDRRAARTTSGTGLPAVAARVPSAARLREGFADAADRARDTDVSSTVADAAHAVRHAAGRVAPSPGELADVVRDHVGKATASGKEAVAGARSGLTGS